ncbi:MAG: hypothetical protein WDW36_008011 [Sanguina aurantia]
MRAACDIKFFIMHPQMGHPASRRSGRERSAPKAWWVESPVHHAPGAESCEPSLGPQQRGAVRQQTAALTRPVQAACSGSALPPAPFPYSVSEGPGSRHDAVPTQQGVDHATNPVPQQQPPVSGSRLFDRPAVLSNCGLVQALYNQMYTTALAFGGGSWGGGGWPAELAACCKRSSPGATPSDAAR